MYLEAVPIMVDGVEHWVEAEMVVADPDWAVADPGLALVNPDV